MDAPAVDWQAAYLLEMSMKKASLVNDLSLLRQRKETLLAA